MSTRTDRLDALEQSVKDYVSKEKTRIDNEVQFLKDVLKGRTGGAAVSRAVEAVSSVAYNSLTSYLYGDITTATFQGSGQISSHSDTSPPARPDSVPGSADEDIWPATVKTAVGYLHGKPRDIVIMLADYDTMKYLSIPAAKSYIKMKNAAAKDGIRLRMNLGFRTYQEQERYYQLYLSGRGSLAAKPGYSNHQMGIAADIRVRDTTLSPEYQWLYAHRAIYKFYPTVLPQEPWHWEYQG